MKDKYKKFYMMFDKRFKNLILCPNLNSDSRMILLGFYTSDPYDDEGVPILRITDIQKKYSALDGAIGS